MLFLSIKFLKILMYRLDLLFYIFLDFSYIFNSIILANVFDFIPASLIKLSFSYSSLIK